MVYDYVYRHFATMSWMSRVFTVFTIWVATGQEVVIGHELAHRKEILHQVTAHICYLRFLYTDFSITHNQGHHKTVATPLDPASANKGENVFPFGLRSMIGGFWQGWAIEKDRLLKKDPQMGAIRLFLRNRILHLKMTEAAWLSAVYLWWGAWMVAMAVLVGKLSHFGLEVINYVEHYGLRRKEISPGKYERTGLEHSWNSSHVITNLFTFRLPRHSDHHETGSKPYQALENSEVSP